MSQVKYTRIWTDAAGESHFQDVEADLHATDFAPPAPPLDVSPPLQATRCLFVHAPAGWYGDWHPTPCRQMTVYVQGVCRVQTSDGETRLFHTGDCLLAEDTTGKGHQSRVVGTEDVVGLFVQLPD